MRDVELIEEGGEVRVVGEAAGFGVEDGAERTGEGAGTEAVCAAEPEQGQGTGAGGSGGGRRQRQNGRCSD